MPDFQSVPEIRIRPGEGALSQEGRGFEAGSPRRRQTRLVGRGGAGRISFAWKGVSAAEEEGAGRIAEHETPGGVIANRPDGERYPEGARYQERQQADSQGDAEVPYPGHAPLPPMRQ